ncbi:PLD nuclease N-terminal domain-containing protein [Agrococcus sp. KRD186]|uniref:PLD nuclease N-terminal domain-containing protein n=1 Tax=Agrococcus sp. KRD186 TaxID=2729730 RepID=UPI001F4A0370|nr:PLD nuclease N-terminal domain-containing protein [Agrococcus sp. KRD186]
MIVHASTSLPNPLLPAGYDLIWSGIVLVVVVLAVTALWQALRSKHYSGGQQLMWALLIVVAPVLGALAWFVLGRPSRATAPASS